MDSLPKVTLLGHTGNTFVIGHGTKTFEFHAGKALRVPVPIALLAAKKKDRRGLPLFSIADMPEIVRPKAQSDVEAPVPGKKKRQTGTARTSQGALEI